MSIYTASCNSILSSGQLSHHRRTNVLVHFLSGWRFVVENCPAAKVEDFSRRRLNVLTGSCSLVAVIQFSRLTVLV